MKIFRIKKNRKASKINIFSNRFLINRIDPTSRNHNSSKAKLLTKAWTNDIFYCRVATWPTNVEIRVFPRSDEGVRNATRTGKGGRQGWKHGGVRREKYPCRIVLFFSFLYFFFFFRRDTSSMTRTEADSAQKTSLRLRAGAGSRCYLLDMGRCFARCRYIPLTNYSTDPRLSTMRCRWLLNEALETRSSIEGVGVKVWTDGSFPWFP